MPSRMGYLVALGVFGVGMIGFAAFLFFGLRGLGDELPRFVVPGTTELALNRTGTYTIFHESESVVDGRVYAPADVSGLSVEVVSAETGQSIPLDTPGASSSYTLGGRSGTAVLTFEVEEPGPYRLIASYANGSGPETVLAVGHGFGRRLFMTVAGAIAIAFGSAGIALAIAVVTFVRRRRARQPPVQPRPVPVAP